LVKLWNHPWKEITMTQINSQLMDMAMQAVNDYATDLRKQAFVPAGDPSIGAAAGGPGAPPDPSMMGGAPPMDPSMMGGAPPMDPSMMGGAPPAPAPAPAPAGAGGAPVEPIKPKIDVNIEIMRMNKMLARISDALGIQIPASEMVGTSDDLTQMAMNQQTAGAPAGGEGGGSAIQAPSPIDPMQAAAPEKAGSAGTPYSPIDTQQMAKNAGLAQAIFLVTGNQAA
jgi:hypothetical protein